MTKNKQKKLLELAELKRRLKVLQLAEYLGSVKDACEQMGFSRTQFYIYKKRYEEQGLDGLRNIPKNRGNHPQTTPDEVKDLVKELSIANPLIGTQHISSELEERGIHLSSASVHKILEDSALSKRRARWIFMENLYLVDVDRFTQTQMSFLNKMNPCHAEKKHQGQYPGQLLVADSVLIGKLADKIKIYLHFVVDSYSNIVFALVANNLEPTNVLRLFNQQVLPFYKNAGLSVEMVETHKGRTYYGNNRHDFRLFLNRHHIKHSVIEPTKERKSNGFADRFSFITDTEYKATLAKLIKNYHGKPTYEAIANHFALWLKRYNNNRGHFGFPNYSIVPMQKHRQWIEENPKEER